MKFGVFFICFSHIYISLQISGMRKTWTTHISLVVYPIGKIYWLCCRLPTYGRYNNSHNYFRRTTKSAYYSKCPYSTEKLASGLTLHPLSKAQVVDAHVTCNCEHIVMSYPAALAGAALVTHVSRVANWTPTSTTGITFPSEWAQNYIQHKRCLNRASGGLYEPVSGCMALLDGCRLEGTHI